ncbi:TPA: hypothetical protein HA265_01760 [Candidatus Woesearchaeota archaeon]|nr:hypothetical protein [Candidatus Woesearchaeota archaeon]
MTAYKRKEDVVRELAAIDPALVDKYQIFEIDDGIDIGVVLERGRTTISHRISVDGMRGTFGATKGLYEVWPDCYGVGFMERFGTSDDVAGELTLRQAVEIAEATETRSPKLLEIVAKYFDVSTVYYDWE